MWKWVRNYLIALAIASAIMFLYVGLLTGWRFWGAP